MLIFQSEDKVKIKVQTFNNHITPQDVWLTQIKYRVRENREVLMHDFHKSQKRQRDIP